jgi:uncharacterized integral membrane protein
MERQPARTRDDGGLRLTPRRVIFIVLLVLAVVFAAQNAQWVDLTVYFWEFRLRLVWALLIFGAIGALLGWMVPRLRAGRRR